MAVENCAGGAAEFRAEVDKIDRKIGNSPEQQPAMERTGPNFRNQTLISEKVQLAGIEEGRGRGKMERALRPPGDCAIIRDIVEKGRVSLITNEWTVRAECARLIACDDEAFANLLA